MANRPTKQCSALLAIIKMQTKTRYTTHKMTKRNNNNNIKYWPGCGETAPLIHRWWECLAVQLLQKQLGRFCVHTFPSTPGGWVLHLWLVTWWLTSCPLAPPLWREWGQLVSMKESTPTSTSLFPSSVGPVDSASPHSPPPPIRMLY